MLILVIALAAALIAALIKLKSLSKLAASCVIGSAISCLAFFALKEKLEDVVDFGTGYIFLILLIISLFLSLLLAVWERDASFALAILPTHIAGSILSSILFTHILDYVLDTASQSEVLLGFLVIPLAVISFIIVIAITYGIAIGFPLAVCFITKQRSTHQIVTLFSGIVCTGLLAIAISHSGLIFYLEDSFSIIL